MSEALLDTKLRTRRSSASRSQAGGKSRGRRVPACFCEIITLSLAVSVPWYIDAARAERLSAFASPVATTQETVAIRGQVSTLLPDASFEGGLWLDVSDRAEPVQPQTWVVADIDGDGYADLVYPGPVGGTLEVARSNGRDRFVKEGVELPMPGEGTRLIGSADTDGDGCADIIAWNTDRHELSRGRGDCHGGLTWEAPLTLPRFGVFSFFTLVDPDGTGRTTALMRDLGGGPIYRLRSWASPQLDEMPRLLGLMERVNLYSGAADDFDGDGRTDVLVPDHETQRWYLARADGDPGRFAAFPFDLDERIGLPADINADGRADLVLNTASLTGWWAAFSNGDSAVERPIESPFPSTFWVDHVAAGDVNGDGIDDLVAYSSALRQFRAAVTKSPPPVAGVRITADDGAEATTDASGRFVLQQPRGRTVILTAARAGFRFVPERRVLRAEARTKQVRFAAHGNIDPAGLAGRAVTLGGDMPGPYVCIGYVPVLARFSSAPGTRTPWRYDKWSPQYYSCPDGYALLNVNDVVPERPRRPGADFRGTCCRLPAPDILTDSHTFVDGRCPEGSVATGARPSDESPTGDSQIRCTGLNKDRYMLGPRLPGQYWGFALGMRKERARVPKSQLPLAFRYGAGRQGYSRWDTHGCAGYPWGSLLTDAGGARCAEYQFRQLEYQGAAGDPAKGTPVRMFPDCVSLDNIYDPTAGCGVRR